MNRIGSFNKGFSPVSCLLCSQIELQFTFHQSTHSKLSTKFYSKKRIFQVVFWSQVQILSSLSLVLCLLVLILHQLRAELCTKILLMLKNCSLICSSINFFLIFVNWQNAPDMYIQVCNTNPHIFFL